MKKYPFSLQNHAHDIELRLNRAWICMHDMEMGDTPWNDDLYNRLTSLHDALQDLLQAMLDNSRDGKVTFLTGQQIGLAKESVAWARNRRANSLIKAGKTEFLAYC